MNAYSKGVASVAVGQDPQATQQREQRIRTLAGSRANSVIKRGVDIIGAVVGLVLSVPLVVVFGLLIYSESKGSIFYKQVRVGRGGRRFTIYKLRSMKLDSEADGAGWTVENDPRCLRVGALMRRLNIDEVPQFWNVLRGDMSLVGPRPERPEHIARLEKEVPGYHERHAVKPGITGWAQVNGWRGDTDIRERVKCDVEYIERAGVIWDFSIMLQTFIRRKNAY